MTDCFLSWHSVCAIRMCMGCKAHFFLYLSIKSRYNGQADKPILKLAAVSLKDDWSATDFSVKRSAPISIILGLSFGLNLSATD